MKFIFTLLFLLAPSCLLGAEVQLSGLFSDGAVFQQKALVPVWGWAEPGTKVTVLFKGQSKTTTTPESKKWMIKLDPLTASSEGATMTVTVGKDSKEIHDILVGEVWICGGQSNMARNLGNLVGDKLREPRYQPILDYLQSEIKTANDPLLRHIRGQGLRSPSPSPFKEHDNVSGEWVKAVSGTVEKFTGTGYFFARELRKQLNVPVGLVNTAVGATAVEQWIPMSAFQTSERMKEYYNEEMDKLKKDIEEWDPAEAKRYNSEIITAWEEEVALAKKNKTKLPKRPKKELKQNPTGGYRNTSSRLYNVLVAPVVPYAAKGAIWYQGESSGARAIRYKEHFSALINGWRKAWGQDKFYFFWCQLASYGANRYKPVDAIGGTVMVRDHQRLALSLPDTGMAVLNDIGEAEDIHPKNKIDVGKRLSLLARKKAYGEDIVASGPLYKSSEIKGNKVFITFSHVGSGLMVGKKVLLQETVPSDEPLKYFQICGKDRKWVWADAEIISKDTVEVSHKTIAAPIEVRYAWASNSEGANLYNKEGLPASLFKTK